MIRIYVIIASLFSLLLWSGCEKENTFVYQSANILLEDIDSIYFSPGHHSLIADGTNQLDMVVEVFRNYKYTNKIGQVRDSLVQVSLEFLPEGALEFVHVETGTVSRDFSFKLNDASQGVASLYAQIGNIKSETKEVLLREPPVLPEKRIIKLIFHLFELSPNDPKFNKYTNKEVTYELLQLAVEDLNNVFNNKLSNSANSASANIEFQLATLSPSGSNLKYPGYNLTYYSYDEMANYGSLKGILDSYDFVKYINDNSSKYFWDTEEYLNVTILPISPTYSYYDAGPQAQIPPEGEDPKEGMGKYVSSEDRLPVEFRTKPYESYGLSVAKSVFFPGSDRRITIAQEMGKFWGLLSPTASIPTFVDYCNDTRKYWLYEPIPGTTNFDLSKPQASYVLRVGWDGYKFKCNNMMDDVRYASLRNTLTLDQVNRIRYALDYCPRRRPGRQ
jgi:hypothetical protein